MKKVHYIIVVILLLISCEGPQIMHKDSYYLSNKTGKKIIHQVAYNKEYTAGVDTLFFFSDGTSDKTEFEWTVTSIFNSDRNVVVSVDGTNVYNITDTTSLGWSLLSGSNGIYTRFGKNIDNTSFKDNDYYTFTGDYYLTIDNELLSLMLKDYTMLEKFKENYQK